MPRFHYTAIDSSGKKTKGTIAAESPYAARKQLRLRSIHPTDIREAGFSDTGKKGLSLGGGKKARSQVIDFTREMSTLLNSGIKLTEALTVLTQQAQNQRFKAALTDIRDRVMTGETFSETLRSYTDYFDIIYVSMVKVGEVTGSLGDIFGTIAGFMSKKQKVESKVMTAMMYPLFLIAFALLAVIILTVTVIPTIANQIQSTGKQLPWITQQLMNFSSLITSLWVFVLIGSIALIVYLFRRLVRTKKGAYYRDKTLLSLPVFGELIRKRVVARFTSTLSTLMGSGLSMAESLRVVAEVTGNVIMSNAVKHARERIMAGADIATPLRESGVIDPTIAHMVAIGEKSGELEMMLKNISESLEEQTDIVIERMSAAIEPLIIIFMVMVVGVIAIAVILPILEVTNI